VEFDLDAPVLAKTPQVLKALLIGLSEESLHANYGEATWSPHEVVGHLIHGEQTDWIPRARLIMHAGESVPFDPFDRCGHADLCSQYTTSELLCLFEEFRAANLAELHSWGIQPADFARQGRHPALGRVTLGELLATWVVHDLNHIAQVCKGLAFQHRREVGPWEAYLSILASPRPR
jgi:DinB superfamily